MTRTRTIHRARASRDVGEVWLQGGAILLLAALAGCASAPPPPPPPVDAGAVQREAEDASRLDRPYRVEFAWEFQEPGVRIRGRGVARVEPPYRARLDLFSANGERLAAAALVDDALRVPPGMAVPVPPAPMLWGALGVFRPGPGTYAAQATRPAVNRSTLRFLSSEGGDIHFSFVDRRIDRVERSADGGVREELRVRFGPAEERFPREAVWRDVAAVRELRITTESVEVVESYPSHIWNPDA
jgi:hypothetical protein